MTTALDITAAQMDDNYRTWLASRLTADQWDAVSELLDYLATAYAALGADPDVELDPDLAAAALLNAEDALAVVLGLLVDGQP